MKGLSIFLTLALLVLAHQLARQLKKRGALPAENRPANALTESNPLTASNQAHRLGNPPNL